LLYAFYAAHCSIESRQHIPDITINNIRKRSIPIKKNEKAKKGVPKTISITRTNET
jgi:hypothetical protein